MDKKRKYTDKEIIDSLQKADIMKPNKHPKIVAGAGLASTALGSFYTAKRFGKGPASSAVLGGLAAMPSYLLGAIPTALSIDAIKSKKMKEKGFKREDSGRINFIPEEYQKENTMNKNANWFLGLEKYAKATQAGKAMEAILMKVKNAPTNEKALVGKKADDAISKFLEKYPKATPEYMDLRKRMM